MKLWTGDLGSRTYGYNTYISRDLDFPFSSTLGVCVSAIIDSIRGLQRRSKTCNQLIMWRTHVGLGCIEQCGRDLFNIRNSHACGGCIFLILLEWFFCYRCKTLLDFGWCCKCLWFLWGVFRCLYFPSFMILPRKIVFWVFLWVKLLFSCWSSVGIQNRCRNKYSYFCWHHNWMFIYKSRNGIQI